MNYSNFDISKFHIPRWEELPTIDLYMDQVLTYIDEYLSGYVSDEKEDKILTKTMINNYVKQEIIEPPIKKKYNQLHIAKLFVICILKQVYSINDIYHLINLALKTSSANVCYNRFCTVLEDSLTSTFKGLTYSTPQNLTSEQYILKNVVQSFVNKLYVQITYLKNE